MFALTENSFAYEIIYVTLETILIRRVKKSLLKKGSIKNDTILQG